MRKQSGFTLIELMVVMAIIAILATAGISAYGTYVQKARDATRLEDMRALENIAIASFNGSGQAPDYAGFIAAVSAMNNSALLKDPMDTKDICLYANPQDGVLECGYKYFQCDGGGYVLRVVFESTTNTPLYAQDKLNSGDGATTDAYEIGSCTGNPISLSTPLTNFIR